MADAGRDARATIWDGRPRPSEWRKRLGNVQTAAGVWTSVGPGKLRRSKIFIVTGLKHATSSVGAASYRDPQVSKMYLWSCGTLKAFQQLDVLCAKALASMMLLLVLNLNLW